RYCDLGVLAKRHEMNVSNSRQCGILESPTGASPSFCDVDLAMDGSVCTLYVEFFSMVFLCLNNGPQARRWWLVLTCTRSAAATATVTVRDVGYGTLFNVVITGSSGCQQHPS
ncbi:hypothetical protein TSMEX_006633, partial [Taenia solium]